MKENLVADGLFLLLIVLISSLPYISRLGFYSDDWGVLTALVHSSDHGVVGLYKTEMALDPALLVRPVQIVYSILSWKLFGLHPLGYHIVNTVLLGVATASVYVVLKELRTGRSLSFVIALIFGLLPHYSADRFWFAAHQATFSMAFALCGIYALLRSVRPDSKQLWVVLAIVTLVLSILSYEVELGLIIFSLLFIGGRAWLANRSAPQHSATRMKTWPVLLAGLALVAVGLIKTVKQTRIAYHHNFYKHLLELSWQAVMQMIQFNFWTYAFNLPHVLKSLFRQKAIGPSALLVAAAVAILVAWYLWRSGTLEVPSRRSCFNLTVLGTILFFLGYALFSADPNTDFSSTGIASRFAIASALGAACVLVGIAGLVCSVLLSSKSRSYAYILIVTLFCGANCLVISGIAFYWADASVRQAYIIREVTTRMPPLPRGSVLFLDGFCRFSGPGIVFESDWDATGALQLALNDNSLTGDVVSSEMRFETSDIITTLYGSPESKHSYGNNVFVYNVSRGVFKSLPSFEAARDYVRTENPQLDSGCPAARDGDGIHVF